MEGFDEHQVEGPANTSQISTLIEDACANDVMDIIAAAVAALNLKSQVRRGAWQGGFDVEERRLRVSVAAQGLSTLFDKFLMGD